MNLEQKGVSVQGICRVMGISRASYYREGQRKEDARKEAKSAPEADEALADTIREIQREWPGYGVRRVWAVLRFDRGLVINIKRVRRVMQAYGLLQKPASRAAVRRKHTGKVAVSEPDRLWGTDLTKTWTEVDGWVGVVPLLDYGARDCLAWRVSKITTAAVVNDVIDEAIISRFGTPEGVPEALVVRSDNGPQFTAHAVQDNLRRWGVHHQKTPFHCPEGNSVVERFMRTLKEECLWQHHLNTLEDVERALSAWIPRYNTRRRHQSLGYLTPAEYRKKFTLSQPEVLRSQAA
ncbi:MAG: IS3 family transposase [Deltaproteobacteria bacterium]|nr:IS3 family transposase [Deltaproteobacteria bacterium]